MPEPRTKSAAVETLRSLFENTVQDIADPAFRRLCTTELVSEVFDQAWKHQFEDDRSLFQRFAREIVMEAVEPLAGGTKS